MADVGLAMRRAIEKTEAMKERASAVEEIQPGGRVENLTALGPAQSDIDRQLEQLGAKRSVDATFAELEAELGNGRGPTQTAAAEPSVIHSS
jgi:phage shock protein A